MFRKSKNSSSDAAIDMSKKLKKSDQIRSPEDLEKAIIDGDTILGCSFSIDGIIIDYIYKKQDDDTFVIMYPTADHEVHVWLAEQYSPTHVAVAWHTNEYLFRDNESVVDLDKVRWDAEKDTEELV